MSFKYKIKTAKVLDDEGDEVGEVRGLSLNALVTLIDEHRDQVQSLFDRFQGRDADGIPENEVAQAGFEMISKAPVFVAQIIATATGIYEGHEQVEGEETPLERIMSMPAGLQFAFLAKIFPLTFNAGGGAKKMLALALGTAQGGSQSDD